MARTTQFNVRLPQALLHRLHRHRNLSGVTLSSATRIALSEYLDRRALPTPPKKDV